MLPIVWIGKHVFDLSTSDGPELARKEMADQDVPYAEIQNVPYEDLDQARAAEFVGMEPANMKFYRQIFEPRGRV